MKYRSIHLICRAKTDGIGFVGVRAIKNPLFSSAFSSGRWDLSEDVARSLVGGLIFLHQTKSSPSQFGGLIYEYYDDPDPTAAHEHRISFRFLALSDARYVDWQGASHAMAWTSGVTLKELPLKRTVPVNEQKVGLGHRMLKDIPEDYISELQAKAT